MESPSSWRKTSHCICMHMNIWLLRIPKGDGEHKTRWISALICSALGRKDMNAIEKSRWIRKCVRICNLRLPPKAIKVDFGVGILLNTFQIFNTLKYYKMLLTGCLHKGAKWSNARRKQREGQLVVWNGYTSADLTEQGSWMETVYKNVIEEVLQPEKMCVLRNIHLCQTDPAITKTSQGSNGQYS